MTDIEDMTAHELHDGRRLTRADTRHLVSLKVGDHVKNARLLDVSLIGARIETSADLTIGDMLKFCSARTGERPAEVVWIADGRAGLRFLDKGAILAVTRRR